MRKTIGIKAGLLVILLLAGIGSDGPAHAANFENVVVSSVEDGATEAVFPADTPEIFIRANMVDVPAGAVVTVTWLAVDTGPENPPNFRLNRVSLPIGPVGRLLRTSIARPGKRWLPGAYRVRLDLNGRALERIDFAIR